MSLYYLILWNQVDILQKHLKKDHVHMRLWTRFYCICLDCRIENNIKISNFSCTESPPSALLLFQIAELPFYLILSLGTA